MSHSLRLEHVQTTAKLTFLIAQYSISLFMEQGSTKNTNAHLEDSEVEALLRYLVNHRATQEGSGGFKTPVFQGDITAIAPFYEKGAIKDVKNIKWKWGM